MNKCILIILALCVSVAASAGGGRSGWVELSKLQIIEDGVDRMFVYDVVMNNSDCDSKTPTLFFTDSGLSNEIYSMILSAKVAKAKVELIASNCVSIGNSTYPSISSIYME